MSIGSLLERVIDEVIQAIQEHQERIPASVETESFGTQELESFQDSDVEGVLIPIHSDFSILTQVEQDTYGSLTGLVIPIQDIYPNPLVGINQEEGHE